MTSNPAAAAVQRNPVCQGRERRNGQRPHGGANGR